MTGIVSGLCGRKFRIYVTLLMAVVWWPLFPASGTGNNLSELPAQTGVTVKGYVIDSESKEPVQEALVRIYDVITGELLADSIFTNQHGYYESVVSIAVTIGNERIDLAREYSIESVFPNPVHSHHSGVEIHYTAPVADHGVPVVEVFDLLGRRVPANARLASGYYGFRLRFPDGHVTGFQPFLVIGSANPLFNAIRLSGSGDNTRLPVLASGATADAGSGGHVRVEVRKPGYRPASTIAPVIDQVAEHLFELDPLETVTLAVNFTSGPPGTILELTGLEAGIFDPEDLQVYFGDFESVMIVQDDTIVTTIPLPDDEDIWTGLPDDPVLVEVRIGGWVAGRTDETVTIEALIPAPGTTVTIRDQLLGISDGLIDMFRLLPVVNDYEQAVIMALEELFHEVLVAGDSSLTRALQESAGDLDIIDAMLASSGALEYYGSLLDFVNSANGNGPDHELAAMFRWCRQGGADMDLACRMQIYEMLTDFTEYVVSPTVKGFAQATSIPMSYAALRKEKVPYVKVVSAVLTVVEFILKYIAPGLYPSAITSFELTVDKDCLELDEQTESEIVITAVNQSPETTATEIIQLALTIIGVAHQSPEIQTFKQLIIELIKRALGAFNRIMGAAINHFGLQPVDGVTLVPPMTWGPIIIEESDLVRLISQDPTVIVEDEDALEWTGIDRGRANIQVETRGPGARSRVLTFCPGCQYHGGAFGNNIVRTPAQEMRVDEDGNINFSIIGLPGYLEGDVEIEGEEFFEHVTGNAEFEEIDPGDYTITARSVPDPEEDNEYDPEEDFQTIEVEACDVVTFAFVTYKPRYGQLAVDISGLPPGESADVFVTGDGFEQNLSESETITRLEPGEYVITGLAVIAGEHVYDAVPRSMTVTVTAGETTPADIEYCIVGSESGDGLASGASSIASGNACPPWAGTINVTRTLRGSSDEWDVWDTVTSADFFVRLEHNPSYSLSAEHFVASGDGDRVSWSHAEDRRKMEVPCNGSTITETRRAHGGGSFDLAAGAGPTLRMNYPATGQYSIEPFMISTIGMGTGASYEFSTQTSLCNWEFEGSGFFIMANSKRSTGTIPEQSMTIEGSAQFGPDHFSAELYETITVRWNLFNYE